MGRAARKNAGGGEPAEGRGASVEKKASSGSLAPPWSPEDFGGWRRGKVHSDDRGRRAIFRLGKNGRAALSYDVENGWEYSGPVTNEQATNIRQGGGWEQRDINGTAVLIKTDSPGQQIISGDTEWHTNGIRISDNDAREIAENKSRHRAFSEQGSQATTYEERVAELEAEGETTSDAQGIADGENWPDDPMRYLREERAARKAAAGEPISDTVPVSEEQFNPPTTRQESRATTYEERVAELEAEGETTSDAQGIADGENWPDDPMEYLRERRAAKNAPSALDMRNEEHLLREESRGDS